MSRTTRKRPYKPQEIPRWWLGDNIRKNNDKLEEQEIARFYSDKYSGVYSLPKHFRKTVTRSRRSRDRQALHQFVHNGNEDACFDPWNCKTANTWGYW